MVYFKNFILILQPIIEKRKQYCFKKQQMSHLTSEKMANLFAEFGGKASNTGSIEGQVALLTERINHISDHLKTNKKGLFDPAWVDDDGWSA